jgi:two-component system LytT family response regulator
VIFVTAYDEYALKAFEADALDYLVKPVNSERLEKAVSKVTKLIEASKTKISPSNEPMRHLFIKDGNHSFFIKLTDIHYIRSAGNYCEVYFGNNKAMLHKSLNLMEERLPSHIFFRANRQEIFNLDYVDDVDVLIKNAIQVTLKTGKMIELSLRQSIKFREIMSI